MYMDEQKQENILKENNLAAYFQKLELDNLFEGIENRSEMRSYW